MDFPDFYKENNLKVSGNFFPNLARQLKFRSSLNLYFFFCKNVNCFLRRNWRELLSRFLVEIDVYIRIFKMVLWKHTLERVFLRDRLRKTLSIYFKNTMIERERKLEGFENFFIDFSLYSKNKNLNFKNQFFKLRNART